ncbi:hypothetical protein J2W97_001926 [Paenibacillus jamilae]|nr:hypothetical protein [Paenibacillus jamilae]
MDITPGNVQPSSGTGISAAPVASNTYSAVSNPQEVEISHVVVYSMPCTETPQRMSTPSSAQRVISSSETCFPIHQP